MINKPETVKTAAVKVDLQDIGNTKGFSTLLIICRKKL